MNVKANRVIGAALGFFLPSQQQLFSDSSIWGWLAESRPALGFPHGDLEREVRECL